MKVIIEEEDINDVKEMAERLDVVLTDDQAKALIENNINLQVEILNGGDDLDEHVSDALVEWIMEESSTKGREWQWPTYGDADSYKKEFRVKFVEAAGKIGIPLGEYWRSDSEEDDED